MVQHADPATWTEEYAAAHYPECLTLLQSLNKMVIYHVEERDYPAAIAGVRRLRQGFAVMNLAQCCGDLYPHMSASATVEGMLLVYGEPAKFKGETEANRRGEAIKAFQTALDCARDVGLKQATTPAINSLLAALSTGRSFVRIKQKYPLDLQEGTVLILDTIDQVLFAPELARLYDGQAYLPPSPEPPAPAPTPEPPPILPPSPPPDPKPVLSPGKTGLAVLLVLLTVGVAALLIWLPRLFELYR